MQTRTGNIAGPCHFGCTVGLGALSHRLHWQLLHGPADTREKSFARNDLLHKPGGEAGREFPGGPVADRITRHPERRFDITHYASLARATSKEPGGRNHLAQRVARVAGVAEGYEKLVTGAPIAASRCVRAFATSTLWLAGSSPGSQGCDMVCAPISIVPPWASVRNSSGVIGRPDQGGGGGCPLHAASASSTRRRTSGLTAWIAVRTWSQSISRSVSDVSGSCPAGSDDARQSRQAEAIV